MRLEGGGTLDGRMAVTREPAGVERSPPTKPERPESDGPSPFAQILRGLGKEVDRGEAIVRRATTGSGDGRDLGNGELLALQAGVYRYSEAVDLSTKLVDRATSGIKTVLQGQ
jgi:hypothetical protein